MPRNLRRRDPERFDFDVCLSFAGEDRDYVADVARWLDTIGIRTFYDEHEQLKLWGKDLYSHLADVYQNAARYCVIFVSRHYSRKLWTNHERKAAQARAFRESHEYLLPVRFDRTQLPGLLDTTGYIDASSISPSDLAQLIARKVGRPTRKYYVPPVPDRLFAVLKTRCERDRGYVVRQATALVEAFKRMSKAEKLLVLNIFRHGCPSELPDNIHISVDLLRRIANVPSSKLLRDLKGVRSVGFVSEILKENTDHGREPIVCLKFECRYWDYDGPDDATGTVHEMLDMADDHYCPVCATTAILSGDFSHLSSATSKPEGHARTSPQVGANRADRKRSLRSIPNR